MTIYHKDDHEEEVALEVEGNGMSRKNSILVDMLSPDGPTIESHDGGRPAMTMVFLQIRCFLTRVQ